MTQPKIEVITSPTEYFQELTQQAAQKSHLPTIGPALDYIGSLLHRALKASPNDPVGPSSFLALSLVETLQKSAQERLRVSQHIGDLSMLCAGIFSDSLNQKVLGIEYYVEMGKLGYHFAHSIAPDNKMRVLFEELSVQFQNYLEVLHHVARTIGMVDMTNILNIYEKWLHTQSPHLRNWLAANGICLDGEKYRKNSQ